MAIQEQQGFTLTKGNLTEGSKGPEVLALQKYLNGLYPDDVDIKEDGIFGPRTKNAVLTFQKKAGIKTDGIVGPETAATLTKIQTTDATTTDGQKNTYGVAPEIWDTFSDAQKASLSALGEYVNTQKAQGYKINPNIAIDEDLAAKFMAQAKNTMHPVYQEQIDSALSQAGRDVSGLASSYEDTQKNAEINYTRGLDTSREQFAGAGGAFSGARGLYEKQTQDVENRRLQGAERGFQSQLGDIARQTEAQVGAKNMSGFSLPTTVSRQASLGGIRGAYDTSGTTRPDYRAGSYKYGEIPEAEKRAIAAKGLELTTAANQRLAQGQNPNTLLI